MNGDVWIVAEQKDNRLRDISLELLAWGRGLADVQGSKLCAVLMANRMPAEEVEKLIWYGADQVYLIQHSVFENFLVEPEVRILQQLVNTYHPDIVLAGATTRGRTLLPYLSIQLRTGLTADCTGLEIEPETGNLLQIRPAIGGNIMATIKTPNTRPQMATVRPKSIRPLEEQKTHQGVITALSFPDSSFASRIHFEKSICERREDNVVEEANFVVSGGQGMQNSETFCLIEEFAHFLGAAVGSSRPPVDLGWQPYNRQIGLSGKTISPALYIACGISGAVQHLAGIQTAKNIIAINNDPEAPIFQVADLGIVGDARQVLPILTKLVQESIIDEPANAD